MAKGDPSGLYYPGAYSGPGDRDLVAWIAQELMRVGDTFELALARRVDFLANEPQRPREGMITGADGTNWDPGEGKGFYIYWSGAWHTFVLTTGTEVYQWVGFYAADQTAVAVVGTSKFVFRIPACTVLAVRGALVTASTVGSFIFDINDDGTSILGANKLSIDVNEKTSLTAATPTTIANPDVADDSEVSIDYDSVGSGAKGPGVAMYVRWTP